MATVRHIFVAAKHGAPMTPLSSVVALADHGLFGDRYDDATLIELENIEAFTRATGLDLAPQMPRRSIVTQGVRLNELRGRRFKVGAAVFEGLELWEPCRLFAKRTYPEVLGFFAGKGGLRARIITGGEIRVGDSVLESGMERAP
jgi:MOSC domain-containing protein YiiM